MGLKERLLKFKAKIVSTTKLPDDICASNYSLDGKVDEFIKWYDEEFVKGHYTNHGEFRVPKDMRNIIEKMAVWYEIRYPEYEVSRKYPGSSYENKKVNEIFIQKNVAIKEIEELLDGKEKECFFDEMNMLEWSNILSAKAFLHSLTWEEKWFLARPKYRDLVYLNKDERTDHFHLSAKGRVEGCEVVKSVIRRNIEYYDFKGWHITDVINYFKEYGIELPENNEIESAIKDYNNRCMLKEKFLDAVMYRIIERGGNRIGPRRAFMFAQEFNRNIDIPMAYGVDYSDPGLRGFINEYIKAGGRRDLKCLVGYGSRARENEPLAVVSVEEMLGSISANCIDKYTKEESGLHQRLINSLSAQLFNQSFMEEGYSENSGINQKRLIKKSQS